MEHGRHFDDHTLWIYIEVEVASDFDLKPGQLKLGKPSSNLQEPSIGTAEPCDVSNIFSLVVQSCTKLSSPRFSSVSQLLFGNPLLYDLICNL